jgi:hypothetical protein
VQCITIQPLSSPGFVAWALGPSSFEGRFAAALQDDRRANASVIGFGLYLNTATVSARPVMAVIFWRPLRAQSTRATLNHIQR